MKSSCKYERELIRMVEPQMSYSGTDYEAWKVKARAKLSELLGMDNFTLTDADLQIEYETESEIDGAAEIRFTYQSEEGYRVPGHLFIPKKAEEKPPVMICIQGHSTGMHISLGRLKYPGDEKFIENEDSDFVIRAIKEGFAAVAIEQRNFGECGEGKLCLEAATTALLSGRTTIGERVWDIMRLIDVVEKNFSDRVNVEKICLMGLSGGGTATAYTAALEDRIILAVPSGALCNYKDSIGAMAHCACNFIPNIANYFEMNDLISMAYPKAYIQVSGTEDDIFPIFGAEEVFEKGRRIYEQSNVSKKCVMVKGKGGHRFFADDTWPVIKELLGG